MTLKLDRRDKFAIDCCIEGFAAVFVVMMEEMPQPDKMPARGPEASSTGQ